MQKQAMLWAAIAAAAAGITIYCLRKGKTIRNRQWKKPVTRGFGSGEYTL